MRTLLPVQYQRCGPRGPCLPAPRPRPECKLIDDVTPPLHTWVMTDQLILVENQPTWKLDPATRMLGRQGVAAARAVLAKAKVANPLPRQQAA